MRDKVKDKTYFENYIDKEKKAIDFFIENTKDKELPVAGQRTFDTTLDLKTRNILIAKYSSGAKIIDLKKDYIESVKWFAKIYNSQNFYVQLIWMLSMGVLLEIDNDSFDILINLVENDDLEDHLVDFLIQSRKPSRPISTKAFKFSIPYKSIESVINETDKQIALENLKKYLDKEWYKGHSSAGWHNSHNGKHNTYFGYWSFESGAVVKILGLDDSSLRDQQYYPYDMVHWKD
ncbi:PoNi-like cognate immunity protein [Zobellia uliginosa]|uniref:PoNi-like cognate immunity protein n=1 Tax=Zobellia uliginosa TaxID=143224 RepID=UPI001C0741A5|nr:PoNi-like cognate immunity protein [Zobellia uliginosa]MBU2946297.1 DUF1911 domain-containing protein [Zobellia uliginosa]